MQAVTNGHKRLFFLLQHLWFCLNKMCDMLYVCSVQVLCPLHLGGHCVAACGQRRVREGRDELLAMKNGVPACD